ncbi:MAG TPA: galactokinase [Ktedonobacteraceae bacterium]|nr:galactokinase [Ktedonobacteraceae bacterium]
MMMQNPMLPRPARDALEEFPLVFQDEAWPAEQIGVAWAPGRVNLIGEHTDYNDGYVLPLAVDRVVAFAGRPRADSLVRLWSGYFSEEAQLDLSDLPASFDEQLQRLPMWARYVLGVMTELKRAGVALRGFDALIEGDVPVGGGMSSSAAIEVATAHACMLFSDGNFTIGAAGATMQPLQVAALCQRAEHIASGVRSGILDQAASCLGQAGKAVLLDCRSLDYRYLPFDQPGIALVVIDTGVRRDLAASAYNERRAQCEEATRLLREMILRDEPREASATNIRALRDITPEQLARYADRLPDVLRRRAAYVIAENARVLETALLLERHAIEQVGPLLWKSHEGLRDDYEVSCMELDTLVEIAREVPGVLGARMLGGGFGGCTINLVRYAALEQLHQAVETNYMARTGRQASIDVCRAAGGPGSVWAT